MNNTGHFKWKLNKYLPLNLKKENIYANKAYLNYANKPT